jgi:rSAM/selenodomain-associated transferase 1
MNSVSSDRVVVFSKSADAGAVKTRMHPVLNSQQCLSLHLSLLQDTIEKAREFSPVLYLYGSGSLPFDPGLPLRHQSGEDLGERMKNAFEEELRHHSKVAIIGTDSPTFPPEKITSAFLALDRHEIVLGPSEDGGYYLIALRNLVPEMFRDVPWGTGEVLTRTLEKLSGRSFLLLEPYFDVDFPEDLIRLKSELEFLTGPYLERTRRWISHYFALSTK